MTRDRLAFAALAIELLVLAAACFIITAGVPA